MPASYDAPLLITIDQLTPGEVPDRGPVTVAGTVANRDVETWTDIRLYPFINAGDDCEALGCPPPITTTAGLVEAAESDPEDVVGARIPEVSATIDELAPGEVRSYSIQVPRRLLPVTTARRLLVRGARPRCERRRSPTTSSPTVARAPSSPTSPAAGTA